MIKKEQFKHGAMLLSRYRVFAMIACFAAYYAFEYFEFSKFLQNAALFCAFYHLMLAIVTDITESIALGLKRGNDQIWKEARLEAVRYIREEISK